MLKWIITMIEIIICIWIDFWNERKSRFHRITRRNRDEKNERKMSGTEVQSKVVKEKKKASQRIVHIR